MLKQNKLPNASNSQNCQALVNYYGVQPARYYRYFAKLKGFSVLMNDIQFLVHEFRTYIMEFYPPSLSVFVLLNAYNNCF